MKYFETIHPDSDVPLSMDFTDRLPTGATVTGGTVTCAVHRESPGADASAASRVYGTADVEGALLTRWFKEGVAGVTYVITFAATFSHGEDDVIEAGLVCIENT